MQRVKRRRNREVFDIDDPDLDAKLDEALRRASERVDEESRRLAEELDDWNPDPDLRGLRIRTVCPTAEIPARAHTMARADSIGTESAHRPKCGFDSAPFDRAGGCSAFPDPPDFFFATRRASDPTDSEVSDARRIKSIFAYPSWTNPTATLAGARTGGRACEAEGLTPPRVCVGASVRMRYDMRA